jgi:cell fate (sporulation/competence/biofilm development) regulator YlbF (YheA/YmcA/DUF963 family)
VSTRETARDLRTDASAWRSDVERAARDLAAVLAQTPELRTFENAYVRLRNSRPAQEARHAFEEAWQKLQPMLMLGVATDEQRAELERLRQAWLAMPATAEYQVAQASLGALCQAVDERLSEHMGIGFAASCRPSCCG